MNKVTKTFKRIIKTISCIALVVAVLAGSIGNIQAQNSQAASKQLKDNEKQVKNVLFIGNSFTYYNTLCNVVQGIAKRNGHNIDVTAATNGGKSLEYNAGAENVLTEIKKGGYDVVVLQDIVSSFDADKLQRGADKIIPIVKQYSPDARIVFYEPWPKKFFISNPESKVPYFTDNYIKTANKVGAELAPAGEAYYDVYTNHGKDYYCKDSLHPQPLGTFVSASTIFFTIFNDDELKLFEESEHTTIDKLINSNVAHAEQGIMKSYPLEDLNLIYNLAYKYAKAVAPAVEGKGKYVSIAYEEPTTAPEAKKIKAPKLKIKKAKLKKKSLKVTFKKAKNIKGINVLVAKKKSFAKKSIVFKKTIKSKKAIKKAAFTVKSKKFKKKMYIKLQAYVTNSGKKTKGKWSKPVRIK